MSVAWQLGQVGVELLRTSSSNSVLQCGQW
jgi:hypothetical protein